jgi:hypothetical protein
MIRPTPMTASVSTSVSRFLVPRRPTSLAGRTSRTRAATSSAMPATTAPFPPAEPWLQAMYRPATTQTKTTRYGMMPTMPPSSRARWLPAGACLVSDVMIVSCGWPRDCGRPLSLLARQPTGDGRAHTHALTEIAK